MENNMTTASIRLDAEVEALLSAAGLPSSDIPGHPSLDLLGVKDGDNRLTGVIGLERYGEIGMLRSLAVAESQRGSGIGQRLVHDVEVMGCKPGRQNHLSAHADCQRILCPAWLSVDGAL